jgi:hypothetical protein
MSLRLEAACLCLPRPLKRRYLERLFRLTAEAFGTTAPSARGRGYEARLGEFAAFTAAMAGEARSRGTEAAVGEDLFRNARAFGQGLGETLGVKTFAEAMAAARLLYRAIGIDFEGGRDGEVVMRSCRFAAVYTPETCRLISALDRGVLSGLAGEGDLLFIERLTEGHGACRARLRAGDERR